MSSQIQWHRYPPRDGQIVVLAHASWRQEMQADQIADELEAQHHCVGWMDHPSLEQRPRVFGHKVKTRHRMITGPAAIGLHQSLAQRGTTRASQLLSALIAGEVPQ